MRNLNFLQEGEPVDQAVHDLYNFGLGELPVVFVPLFDQLLQTRHALLHEYVGHPRVVVVVHLHGGHAAVVELDELGVLVLRDALEQFYFLLDRYVVVVRFEDDFLHGRGVVGAAVQDLVDGAVASPQGIAHLLAVEHVGALHNVHVFEDVVHCIKQVTLIKL